MAQIASPYIQQKLIISFFKSYKSSLYEKLNIFGFTKGKFHLKIIIEREKGIKSAKVFQHSGFFV
ncbi:hypothetical protein EGI15_10445 [Chryseobacterium cucumeris]|uniref:Uncharacterized protein n=1 Tax=Chryseobacterium cucumeris TaxID=1813611 RepID=A0ABX9X6S7_9FLAO|nr:hypothetical protein EGI15_10445 [Chryseobacterium cucumeris]